MTKTIKLALVAALALGATSAFATNGTSLIGFGAKSRAMGGTGISNFNGAESAFANPALITKSDKTTEITIGATILMPSVSFTNDGVTGAPGAPGVTYDSTAGDGMIPAVAAINKVNDSFAWGVALYGTGGMGVDYRDDAFMGGAGAPNDALLLMRMSIPLAYATNGFSVGIAPVIEYGSLSMSTGVTTDIALGFEVGAAYEIAGVSLGLDYKSAVTHDFKNTFDSGTGFGNPKQEKLDSPSVIGLGVSYKMNEHTIALDYKLIGYASAQGLEDFGWEDQSVIALGYEYSAKGWAGRIGYNYGASPLPTDVTDATSFGQALGSATQFPGVTESHITLGGSYDFNEQMSVDLAYMYATGTATTDIPASFGGGSFTATNDQSALSVALNYGF